MIGLYITLGVLAVLIVILLAIFFSNYNNFKRLDVKIEESASSIEVALTKRYDLLTKQLAIAKNYAKHEKDTFTDITKLRTDNRDFSNINESLDKVQREINVVGENYPELKSDKVFLSLQNSCVDVEEHLQASRRAYNANVSLFNQNLATIPSSIVGSMMHLTKKDFFKAEEIKKQDVEMKF